MARKNRTPSYVHGRVLVSFNGMRAGDEFVVELSPAVQGWVNAGMVGVLPDGEDQAGQSGAEPDAAGEQSGAGGGSGASGSGEGEGFGAGGYGAPAGIDQG